MRRTVAQAVWWIKRDSSDGATGRRGDTRRSHHMRIHFSDLLWRAGAGDDFIGCAGDVGRPVFRVEDGDEQNATAGADDHGLGQTIERGALSLNLNSGLQIKIGLDQSVPTLHATR